MQVHHMLTPLSKPCLIIRLVCCCLSPQELFGLDSVHWQGSSHTKGLAQQVAALQAVAAAPVNSRRWRCPAVVVFFPSGVSAEVAAALRAMGVAVADGPGKDLLSPSSVFMHCTSASPALLMPPLHALPWDLAQVGWCERSFAGQSFLPCHLSKVGCNEH